MDAEAPITADGPWQHLKGRDQWERPAGAVYSQCHLMVQMMESWFLADPDTLQKYYGDGFRKNALPQNPNIEEILKQDVYSGLKAATRDTSKKDYDKGQHSFTILEHIDPAKVMSASPYAKRFIDCLQAVN